MKWFFIALLWVEALIGHRVNATAGVIISGNERARPVFREYIGGGGAALSDVPIRNTSLIDFHFILAFAVDENKTGPSDGDFSAFWQPRLSPAAVRAVKTGNPGVKVFLSVGGGGSVPIFAPASIESWLRNALSSLPSIISDYSLDGMDIDYEVFGPSVDALTFSSCIGTLLTHLKSSTPAFLTSIAPYPSTDDFYAKLWSSYNSSIDYVNYQFYSAGDMSVSAYVGQYQQAKKLYSGGIVLASFETIKNGTAIVPSSGMEACKRMKLQGDLPGISVWSADQSYSNFQYEIQAQTLLAQTLPAQTPAASCGHFVAISWVWSAYVLFYLGYTQLLTHY